MHALNLIIRITITVIFLSSSLSLLSSSSLTPSLTPSPLLLLSLLLSSPSPYYYHHHHCYCYHHRYHLYHVIHHNSREWLFLHCLSEIGMIDTVSQNKVYSSLKIHPPPFVQTHTMYHNAAPFCPTLCMLKLKLISTINPKMTSTCPARFYASHRTKWYDIITQHLKSHLFTTHHMRSHHLTYITQHDISSKRTDHCDITSHHITWHHIHAY